MPRGKFTNHKGRNRKFTNPEELEEERRKEEQKKRWRQQRGDESSSEEEEAPAADKKTSEESGSSDSEEESSTDEDSKAKGVSKLIEIENPNRIQKKTKKVTAITTTELDDKPQLSRREREEVEKQRSQAHYQKMHAEGKTEQARADLARLAIIKQQREEAKKRREAEQQEKVNAAKVKTAQTQKALGKK